MTADGEGGDEAGQRAGQKGAAAQERRTAVRGLRGTGDCVGGLTVAVEAEALHARTSPCRGQWRSLCS